MTQNKKHIFEFCAPVSKSSIPLIQSALKGALNTLEVDDDWSKAAAGELASRCKEVMTQGVDITAGNFKCYLEKVGPIGMITIKADCGMDLNHLAEMISHSDIWNKFLKSSEFNIKTGQVDIQISSENR